jgi:mediator of RNA polymerase II transcription subunit 14
MDEFGEEWESVSKIVVITCEGNAITFTPMSCVMYSCWGVCAVVNMAKEKQWEDVQLLSFDLQTVEFTYVGTYHLSSFM